MSEHWRTGVDPKKADRGLRTIGLFVIVLAFLIASNRFVSGGNKPTTPRATTATAPIVAADPALQAILPKIDKAPRFVVARFSAPVMRSATPTTPSPAATSTTPATPAPQVVVSPAVAGSDVIVTSSTATIDALVAAKQCAPAVTVATDATTHPALVYQACAVLRGGAVRPSAQAFIGELTGLSGRVVLVDAGFDLPDRTG